MKYKFTCLEDIAFFTSEQKNHYFKKGEIFELDTKIFIEKTEQENALEIEKFNFLKSLVVFNLVKFEKIEEINEDNSLDENQKSFEENSEKQDENESEVKEEEENKEETVRTTTNKRRKNNN